MIIYFEQFFHSIRYHFKLRYSGPRSHSILSLPLVLMTLPLPPPCPPLIVTLEATTVRIKVYAPEYGTYKYLIQLRAMTSFPGNPLRGVEVSKMGGTSNLIGGTVAANKVINSGDWVTVYYGME